MHIGEALDRYLLQLRADGRSDHTVAQARRHVRLCCAWLESAGHTAKLDDVGHEDLAAFLASAVVRRRADGKPRKATSGNALRSSLRAFWAFANAAGYCRSNPGRLIRRAMCATPPPKGLTEADQAKLLNALAAGATEAEERDRALFELLLFTGARIGSVLSSRVEDLDLDAGELYLRRDKSRRERVLFLPSRVVDLIREHIGQRLEGFVFLGQGQGALTPRHVQRRLQAWCKRGGLKPVSPHALRHSFATDLYAKTGDILLVKAAMGHQSIGSTAIYATVGTGRLREAVIGAC